MPDLNELIPRIWEQQISRRSREILERMGDAQNYYWSGGWGGDSADISYVSPAADLHVERVDDTDGSDTVYIPECAGSDAVVNTGHWSNSWNGVGAERSEGVVTPPGIQERYNAWVEGRSSTPPEIFINGNGDVRMDLSSERRNEMPWSIPAGVVTVNGANYPNYTMMSGTAAMPVEPTRPRNPTEPVLSDDPVIQYHLTAISLLKGMRVPDGAAAWNSTSYLRTHHAIISALESQLQTYKQNEYTTPGLPEAQPEDRAEPTAQGRRGGRYSRR